MSQLLRFFSILLFTVLLLNQTATAKTATKPIPIRVVVVTAFELGEDSGDIAGEFQNWVEKLPLSEVLPAPATYHGVLRYNPELQVLGIVTGEGPTRVASSITALASDPRFDLSHAYFILAGIAGINPNKGTLGTVAWARYAVNGGAAHLLDARDMPADWPDGFTPVQGSIPNPQPRLPIHSIAADMMFEFNPKLVNWAYQRTKDISLPDSDILEHTRQQYKNFPQAQAKPRVIIGDTISSETFWSGPKMNQWAERWVKYWTDGRGEMVTTAMEEIALYQALSYQEKVGRVDTKRILSVRAASNFDAPPPGQSAADKLKEEEREESFVGLEVATSAAYKVASPIVLELAKNWSRYKDHIPQ